MTDILTSQWRISDDAVANPVGDETVILHMANGTYYGLDAIGSHLWESLKEGQPPSAACDRILSEYEVDRETVEEDLRRFLTELAEHGLVENA